MNGKSPSKLPALVHRLGWISLFADICSEMVYPLLPVFLTSVLGAPVFALGMVEGVAESVVSLMKGWSGLHSDRTGKRAPYLSIGYGAAAIAKPILAMSTSWVGVLFARTLDRTGKGLRGPARDAMLADSVDPSRLGAASGFRQGMDTLGAFLGTFLCLALLRGFHLSIQTIFLIAFVPGLIATALTFGLPKAVPKAKSKDSSTEPFSRAYWFAVAVTAIFALANSSDTLPLQLASKLKWNLEGVVLLYIGFNFVFTLAAFLVGRIVDRAGETRIMGIGWTLYALTYWGFSQANQKTIVFWMGFYGISKALTEVGGLVLILKSVPKERKASGIGIGMMIKGFAVLIGNALAGLLWDRFGPGTAFLADSILSLVGVVALVSWLGFTQRKEPG